MSAPARIPARGSAVEAQDGARRTTRGREAEEARRGEWTAMPPGRLGRRLLADVDAYLEFFAIARGG